MFIIHFVSDADVLQNFLHITFLGVATDGAAILPNRVVIKCTAQSRATVDPEAVRQ